MPSLGDAYERRAGTASRKQVVLGTGLFATGALLVVAGILAGATGLLIENGFSVFQSREVGASLAGLGLPAVFVGITIVLPATRVHRAATVFGSGMALLGVLLFRYAYPYRWYAGAGVPSTVTLGAVLVYSIGVIVTFWALFTAVATFKTRNDPGGTVSVSVTSGGAAATVEAAREDFHAAKSALGGAVGVFGGVEDPDPLYRDSGSGADTSASDGGTATDADITSPMDDQRTESRPDEGVEVVKGARRDDVEPDRYCGNCTHFDYDRDGGSMRPYCTLYEEPMDDMAACEWWETNSGSQ
ncbi:DUF7139 domain-containing protein [Halanaeroarchaeum sulfurireducens]|uniref:Uncharacterized protein n=1 Tax=Halanaeroarchaeum sulfurireducens TaxID=1604004 RepID=A0A0F7P8T8_9EURY|nr:hypothetical protein [Halanaeroarchaeum sulfurireducens]AKH97152.1 hypothetical protein HLASF_0656 [Halanaeroarchaeum sulfurireducens]